MSSTTTKKTQDISPADQESLHLLYDVINGEERPILLGREGAHIQFPEPVFHLLVQIVRSMHRGQSVVLMHENEALTTQAAANQLGVSRPHVVKLLEAGEMPYHTVGSHRRVYLRDLMEYQKRRDGERRQHLDHLTGQILDEGYYDADYTGDE